MAFWSALTIIVELAIVLAIAGVAALFVWSLASIMFHAVASPELGKPTGRREDLWDEPDGGTYIQLPMGEVRLD